MRSSPRLDMDARLLLLGCLPACLPPATIETRADPADLPAPPSAATAGECRALISSRGQRGPKTVELRWTATGVSHRDEARGLVAGTAEQLFAVRAEQVEFDARELYGDEAAGLRCEQAVISTRRLPDGVAHPLIDTTPACTGTIGSERVEVESSVELLSAIGPLLSWRARAFGRDPGPIARLEAQSVDLRTATRAAAPEWLAAASETMLREEPERGACDRREAPTRLEQTRGFALVWDEREHLRLRVAYRCCEGVREFDACELDDRLPGVSAELEAWMPDEDGLLHSPLGCGSLGLDGSVRGRDGALVGEHGVAVDELLGVVFLAHDHAFELAWLE